jgi:shikimate dehydrogenase
VVDTVYHPAQTPLLAVARARGATAENGVGMLVGQAALAFTLLTGLDAPLEAMRGAVGPGVT